MRTDRLYLSDIVAAVEAIERFLAEAPEESFLLNDLQQSAILQKLIVIGEAAARTSAATRSTHPHIPWQDIVAFRNIVVHAYFSVDWAIVWHTVTVDVPALGYFKEIIIQKESEAEGGSGQSIFPSQGNVRSAVQEKPWL